MSSPNDETSSRPNVSNLAKFFNEPLSGSEEKEPITRRRSSEHATSQESATDTESILEERVICAKFEKQVGRTQDFKFYYGRNSRSITGLFIRNIQPQSPLAGIIKPQDQLIKVNDVDVKNSEGDAVNRILDNLSGTVRLEVVRSEHREEANARQSLEERRSVGRLPSYDNTELSSEKDEVICATFGKQVGRSQDFMLYLGRTSNRGTTGLFIRNVDPQSALAGVIKPQDQLIKVNDEDVKNSEGEAVNRILDDFSGTVRLEVIRIKQHEGNAKQGLEGKISVGRQSSYDNTALSPEKKLRHTKVPQRIRNKSMKTKKPKKNIDNIKDFGEMLELFKLLNIDYDQQTLDIQEMKKKAKQTIQEQSSGSGKYSNGTTGFAVIAKAKEDDMLKREQLEEFYSKVNDCLKQLDDNAISVLNKYYGDRGICNVLNEQRDRLKKGDYHLLIAGESSSGKSSLLNLILGEELLPQHVLNTTSTICELKYGKERKLVVHHKYDRDQKEKLPPTTLSLKTEEECGKSYQDQIAPFVHLDQTKREEGSNYEKVEIFWPHELLEEGVVIIDSPGLGESDDMDQVLMNYLPNAFAFIYVIDISHAGGVQKDLKGKLMEILEIAQSSKDGTETFNRLAECSLFVCNKWDQVAETQKHEVKKYVVKKLSECWQDANLNNQIVYMSTIEAFKAQQYGGVTTEFNDLLQSIQKMILKAINTRLYNHWQWLDSVLGHIYKVTNAFNQRIQLTNQDNRERMNSIEKRMAKIADHEQDVRKEIQIRLNDQTNVLSSKLSEYINSSEFQKTFITWTGAGCTFPPLENTWQITKSNIKKAIEFRFKELLIQWESKNRIYSEIHRKLVDEFLARLNLIKEELEHVEKAFFPVETQVYDLNNKSGLSRSAKVLVGATSPFWIPVGVAGLIIGMPVFGAIAVKHRVSQKMKFDKYRENPRDYLEKRSKKFFASLTEEVVFKYAQRQMENTAIVLSKYTDSIPMLIEADREIVSRLQTETRSRDEVLQLYTPINQKSDELRENIIPLGIELCPATVDAHDLEWKGDTNSCLGEGEFSLVYRGKLKKGGRNTALDSNLSFNVAVKVFKQPFDGLNSRFYLYEEMMIRYLEHKNVLKFFGAARVSISHSSNEYKFIFVMESCRKNLRSVIFRDKSITPAKAENYKRAIDTFLEWAMEIAAGLNYIHERGLVHRHLKLENILVNEDGTAMISDIGIVGQYLETEKSIIYLAPEVLEELTNRTKAADVYSYGIMLWEMWYGTQAFTELMPLDKSTFQEKITDGYRPKIDHMTISFPGVHVIMVMCWLPKMEERYSAKECCDKFQNILENRNETEDTKI